MENTFGQKGYAMWFKTLETLTKTENHFLDTYDVNTWAYYVSIVRVEEDIVKEMLNLLADLSSIDNEMWYKYHIIWCENLVSNLGPLYSRRHIKPFLREDIIGAVLSHRQRAQPIAEPELPDTMKVESTIKPVAVPSRPKTPNSLIVRKNDYIGQIIIKFAEVYKQIKGMDYMVIEGKDRKAASGLLSMFKTKYTDADADDMLSIMENFFHIVCGITADKFLKTITIAKLYGSINEYIAYIKGNSGTDKYSKLDQIVSD